MSNTYFIDQSSAEVERLNILHQLFLAPSASLLEQCELSLEAPKELVINDVGCATGLMTEWLAKRTTGQVNAIDLDEAQLSHTKARVEKAGLDNVNCMQIDLSKKTIPDVQADITYCRLVVHHLPEPKKGIQHLINMTKPGGLIVIGEPVKANMWFYPEKEEVLEIYKMIFEMIKDHHIKPNYGKQLFHDLKQFDSLEMLDIVNTNPLMPTEALKRHHLLILENFKDKFLERGLVTEQRLDEIHTAAVEFTKDPNAISSIFGVVFVRARRVK